MIKLKLLTNTANGITFLAIGEDGEIGEMINGMIGLTKHIMVLPLRGEFCESSQLPRALPSPRTLPLAGRSTPFQGVNGWCAPQGQLSGSPTAKPWAMETSWTTITPLAMETPWATITPVSATNEKYIIAPKGHKQKGYGTITM